MDSEVDWEVPAQASPRLPPHEVHPPLLAGAEAGRKAWRNSRPAGDPEARQREQVVQGPQEATARQNRHPQVLCQFVRADRQCRNREKKDAVHRLLAASWSEPVNMFVTCACLNASLPACDKQAPNCKAQ